MTEKPTLTLGALPHHKLVAYQVAVQLLICVRDARIRDAALRVQAERAVRSVALNIAEAAGRTSSGDKQRVYGIARGEVCEVASALEVASLLGCIDGRKAQEGLALAERLVRLLTGLTRPR